MKSDKKILVGKIVAAQGLRGEIRVQTYTQNPEDFAKLAISKEQIANKNFKFIRAVPNSSVIIAKIDGINDRTAAEALRGTELFVDRAALPALPEGEFYHADLLDMAVGKNKIIAVHNFGAGDILELDNGEMISFAGAKVDLKNREITLRK